MTGELEEEEVGQSRVDERGDRPHPSQKNTGLWLSTEVQSPVLLSRPLHRLYRRL